MSYYAADTDQVQTVGRSVFNLEPEATSAVTGVLNSYSDAEGVVHHPVVRGALGRYREEHQKGHLAFPEAVKSLGANTATVGSTVADATNEATAVHTASLVQQEGLAREINRPL
jgi:hypothetical protein